MNDVDEVVLIADRVSNHSNSGWKTRTLECTEDKYYRKLFAGLQKSFDKVTHYDHPKKLIENIADHDSAVILSVWAGKNSRNRRTLVPSICEAYNLPYVGADTYTNILCQDKCLSLELVRKLGMDIPSYIIIENKEDLKKINSIPLPIVIKPTLEGGSIGITNDNLVSTYQEATKKAIELLDEFHQPILAEEFIRGEELSFVIYGNGKEIVFCESVQLYFHDPSIKISEKNIQ